MPTYGEDKIRDMAHSVLPSKRRKAAKEDLKNVKRKNRRKVRGSLGNVTRHTYLNDDPADVFDDVEDDFEFFPSGEINYLVRERRNADKINPLMRWAEQATKKIKDPVQRYMWVKDKMPKGLIGRHAMTHVDDVDGIEAPGYNPFYYTRYSNYYRAPAEHDVRAELIKLLAIPGAHKRLNAAIKQYRPWSFKEDRTYNRETHKWELIPCSHSPRVLMGVHDVDDFLVELKRLNYWHPEWFNAMYTVLGDYRERGLV